MFGLQDLSIDVITHHGERLPPSARAGGTRPDSHAPGLTDPLVAQRTLVFAGISAEDAEARWPEVAASMLRYAAEHTADAAHGLEVLPGVAALLAALQARGASVGLVTGNLTPIAWAKMKALELDQYFTTPQFGGFGSDHSDRGELVKIAGQRARLQAQNIRAAWHVGDTVRCTLVHAHQKKSQTVPDANCCKRIACRCLCCGVRRRKGAGRLHGRLHRRDAACG